MFKAAFATHSLMIRGLVALDHPAFKWNHLKADKMIEIQRFRASDNPKTAHAFGSDALAFQKVSGL